MNEDSLFILPEISDEQQLIVDAIKIDNNVIVNAVAGSGKTTTVCHIAKTLPKKRILLLTYNKRLKSETSKTLMNYGITNVYTSNYHSFCYNWSSTSILFCLFFVSCNLASLVTKSNSCVGSA